METESLEQQLKVKITLEREKLSRAVRSRVYLLPKDLVFHADDMSVGQD